MCSWMSQSVEDSSRPGNHSGFWGLPVLLIRSMLAWQAFQSGRLSAYPTVWQETGSQGFGQIPADAGSLYTNAWTSSKLLFAPRPWYHEGFSLIWLMVAPTLNQHSLVLS